MYFIGKGKLEVRLYYGGSFGNADRISKDGKSWGTTDPTDTILSPGQYSTGILGLNNDATSHWRNVGRFGPSETFQKLGILTEGEYFGEYSCLLGEEK